AFLGVGVVDEEPRQVHEPRHPRDDENHVQRLDPGRGEIAPVHYVPRTILMSSATCSTGVSGRMPWPRLNTCGRLRNADTIRRASVSICAPPATSRKGSRLP